MLLQYLYQKGLLYKLVALGQAHPMSVTADGVERKAVGGLYFLVPFLLLVYVSAALQPNYRYHSHHMICTQMYQLVNSLRLLHLYFFVPCSHWQVSRAIFTCNLMLEWNVTYLCRYCCYQYCSPLLPLETGILCL